MSKCIPKRSNFKEFKRFCKNSLEPGVPQFCEDYTFGKLVSHGKTICILGHKYSKDDEELKTYLVGSFSEISKQHVRDMIEWGRVYLGFIAFGPIEILVEDGNKIYERFATFFGFEKTLAQKAINGIMYTVYTRG